MSPGYGNQIYRKRKSHLPLIFSSVVIITFFIIFILTRSDSHHSKGLSPDISNEKISSGTSLDSLKETGIEPAISTNESAEIKTGITENSIQILPNGYSGTKKSSNYEVIIEANQLFSAKKFSQALKLYLSISKPEQSVMIVIGQCYYYLKDYDNAYFYLEKVLEQDRGNFISLKFLAFTAYRTDRLDIGLDYAQEALEIRNDPELKNLLGIIKREKQVMKGYSDIRNPNFRVVFSKTEHGDIKKLILDLLADAYRTIGRDMNYYPPRSVSVILYNEKGFFDITRAPGWVGGLYDGKIRIPIRGITGQEEMLRRILFHEYTHAFIHSITSRCPRWINEGLAEYYSSNNRTTIGQVIPLSYLENVFPSSNAKLIATSYQESFSAVSYLIEKYGSYRLRELLEAFAKGKNIRTAFEAVYFIDYEQFLKTWGRS